MIAKKTQSAQSQNTTKSQPVRNTLDSTAPTIKRGKEREKPKKKRPTKMRKIIAAERAARTNFQKLNFPDDRTTIFNSINEAVPDNELSCVSNLTDDKDSQWSSENNVLEVNISIFAIVMHSFTTGGGDIFGSA